MKERDVNPSYLEHHLSIVTIRRVAITCFELVVVMNFMQKV